MLLWWCCLHASSGCLSDAHYAIDVWTRSVCFLRLSCESVCTEWLLSLSESIPFSSCAAVHTQSQSDGSKAQSKCIGIYFVLFYSQSTQSGFTKSHIHAALYSMHQALSNNNAMPWMGPGRFSMLAEHNADYGNQRASVWYTPQGRAHGIHSMCLVPRMLCRAAPNLNPMFTNDFQRADSRYFPLSAACDRGQL